VDVAQNQEKAAPNVRGPAGTEHRPFEFGKGKEPPLYVIKPDDELQLAIWGEGETRQTVKVGPDGRISWDLAGEVVAAGLTFPDLREELTTRLSKYYWEPRIIINGVRFPGNYVTVMGQVASPGRFEITGVTRLLDVVAMAGLRTATTGEGAVGSIGAGNRGGGMGQGGESGETADLRNAVVFRADRDVGVDFYKLLVEKDLTHNIVMQPGDVVWIPSLDLFKDKVYVIGEIQLPVIIPFTGRMSLLEAIAFAGNIQEFTARKWRVLIVRGRLTRKPEVIPVNFGAIRTGKARDVYLKAGDIVYVPADPLIKIDRIIAKILPMFDFVIQLNAADQAQQTLGWGW
jgi:polysaccharide export outer membrane protein